MQRFTFFVLEEEERELRLREGEDAGFVGDEFPDAVSGLGDYFSIDSLNGICARAILIFIAVSHLSRFRGTHFQ